MEDRLHHYVKPIRKVLPIGVGRFLPHCGSETTRAAFVRMQTPARGIQELVLDCRGPEWGRRFIFLL